MTRRRSSPVAFALVAGALCGLLASSPAERARAADDAVYVRIVDMKASGTLGKGDKPDLDPKLEPLRKHIEGKAYTYSRYDLLSCKVLQGPLDAPQEFELENGWHAQVTPTSARDESDKDRIVLHLIITKDPEKPGDKPSIYYDAIVSLKDGATYLDFAILKALGDGTDLVPAITASKSSLDSP